jgi:hypothetical protein
MSNAMQALVASIGAGDDCHSGLDFLRSQLRNACLFRSSNFTGLALTQ